MKALFKLTWLLIGVVLVGCGKSSLLKTEDFPGVEEVPFAVKVLNPLTDQLCSGVALTNRTVLTAAHCADGPGRSVVISSAGVATAQERILAGDGTYDGNMDLALLLMDDALNLSSYPHLGSNLRQGEKLRVAGFGCRDWNPSAPAGVLSVGENIVDRIAAFAYLVTSYPNVRGILGKVSHVGLCYGDSGGPALRVEAKDELVGLAHAVARDAQNHYSTLIDLTQETQMEFLKAQNEKHGLGINFGE